MQWADCSLKGWCKQSYLKNQILATLHSLGLEALWKFITIASTRIFFTKGHVLSLQFATWGVRWHLGQFINDLDKLQFFNISKNSMSTILQTFPWNSDHFEAFLIFDASLKTSSDAASNCGLQIVQIKLPPLHTERAGRQKADDPVVTQLKKQPATD